MATLDTAETPSITLEEVANDGSSLTNPNADHRRLFLGEDGLIHVKDSAGAVTSPYAAGAGTLLGYDVNTSGDETTSGATLADVDATNAAVTFTAPASGNVLVRLSASASPGSTANAFQTWGLREGSSDIAGAVAESIVVRCATAGTEQYIGATKVFVLTGISAGSHTYKWSWAQSSGTGTMRANASSPAVMEVWAL
jgi:hypothetical protein